MKNLYEILEIHKSATYNEIKSAYKKLSKQHRPDLNPDNKNATENIKEKYNKQNLALKFIEKNKFNLESLSLIVLQKE